MAQPIPPTARGVALIEALIALVVMAFGMLALVGVQATLRLNSDVARQRAEATRIAVQEMEQVRSFISVPAVNGQPGVSWDEIASRTVDPVAMPDGTANTSYRLVRTVTTQGATQKSINVVVSWSDRTGTNQAVTFDSVLVAASPPLSALLRVPIAPSSAVAQRLGRNVSIPPGAVDLGDGRSLMTPPGANAVFWYFNNVTGVMQVCAAQGDSSGCPVASLVSGRVNFDLQAAPSATSPQGPAINLANGPAALAIASAVGNGTSANCYAATYSAAQLSALTWIDFYCAVSTSDVTGWGGSLIVNLVDASGNALVPAAVLGSPKICRYTPSADQYASNVNHPRTYCIVSATTPITCPSSRVTGNLINQNFLVVDGAQACPGSTRPHQPYP